MHVILYDTFQVWGHCHAQHAILYETMKVVHADKKDSEGSAQASKCGAAGWQ
jgi:hypothetical protein